MRSSNPVFSSLTNTRPGATTGGYAGTTGYPAAPGAYTYPGAPAAPGAAGFGTAPGGASFGVPAPAEATRAITVDDIITKTSITLGIIVALGVVNFFLSLYSPGLGMLLTGVGAIGGLVVVLISVFAKKYGSAPITLIYAAFEGLFVGGISFLFAGVRVGGSGAMIMIMQAIVATIGVFIGMLYVYKTGAVKVTDKFRRIFTAALIGVVVLAVVNLAAMFLFNVNPLTNGGPLAIVFSLVCIGLAAVSFLLDFDQADKLVRAGAPANYAWGVALGLAVTLVWLYTEILRLLSYFRN